MPAEINLLISILRLAATIFLSAFELIKIYANKEKFSGFAAFKYWSSESYDDANAWEVNFDNGYQYFNRKLNNEFSVRPIRAF